MTEPEQIDIRYIYEPPVIKPSLRTWIMHVLLLLVTFCTVTVAGTLFPFGPNASLPDADPQTATELFQLLALLPLRYARFLGDAVNTIFTQPGVLVYGLKFSISLLFILICHEM